MKINTHVEAHIDQQTIDEVFAARLISLIAPGVIIRNYGELGDCLMARSQNWVKGDLTYKFFRQATMLDKAVIDLIIAIGKQGKTDELQSLRSLYYTIQGQRDKVQ